MGRLGVFTAKEVIRRLGKLGFLFERQGANHTIYIHPSTQRTAAVPRHSGDLKEKTLRDILKRAGISEAEFLAL
ncbi:MAG: type II toxin-antitoxin system HicA family toxin [bacterium]